MEDIVSTARSLRRLFAPDKFRQNNTVGELFSEWASSCWNTITRHLEVAKETIPRRIKRHRIINLDESGEIINVID